jgi:hypothetical protein
LAGASAALAAGANGTVNKAIAKVAAKEAAFLQADFMGFS